MPKVKLPAIIQEIQGTLYEDMVFKRSPQGKIIISKKPDMSNVKPSKAQMEARERFRQAARYARAALADPHVRAKYERQAKRLKKRPKDLAVSDFYKGKNLLVTNTAK